MFQAKGIVVYAFFLIGHPFSRRLSPKIYLKERFLSATNIRIGIYSAPIKSSFLPRKTLCILLVSFATICYIKLVIIHSLKAQRFATCSYNQFYVKYSLSLFCRRFFEQVYEEQVILKADATPPHFQPLLHQLLKRFIVSGKRGCRSVDFPLIIK
jgi:hypothetical protein